MSRLHWSSRHVGLDAPTVGGATALACWNLVRSVYGSEKGIALPALSSGGCWRKVDVFAAEEFDLLVFGYSGMDTHLAVVVDPKKHLMLHLPEGFDSVVERYDRDPCQALLKGVYRYQAPQDWLHVDPGYRADVRKTERGIDVDITSTRGLAIGRPFITAGEEREVAIAEGSTAASLVAALYPKATAGQVERIRVTINGGEVTREAWGEIVPPDAAVLVEPLPGIFGLRSFLQIGISVAAIAASTLLLGPAGPFWAAAASTAILLGGNLALNRFLPPESGGNPQDRSPTYSIEGWQNVANPDGPFPALLGTHRIAPVRLADTFGRYRMTPAGFTDQGEWTTATPYVVNDSVFVTVDTGDGTVNLFYYCIAAHTSGASTEPAVGASFATVWAEIGESLYSADQWNYALFCGGYGPQAIDISTLRIGEHPIYKPASEWADPDVPESNYGDDFEIDIREGYADDAPVALYPTQAYEEIIGIEMPNGRDKLIAPTIRRTVPNVTSAELDFFFPEGLIELKESGDHDPSSVSITIKYRAVGDVAWSTPVVLAWELQRDHSFGHTQEIEFPAEATYEISVERSASVIDDFNDVVIDRVDFMSLKCFREAYPINFGVPLVLFAVKVRANSQLSGRLDDFNYDGRMLVQDWNGDAWIAEQETSNPASLCRFLLQGPAKAEPVPDEEIDLEKFQDWHEKNDTLGLRYDFVHDAFMGFPETLAQVAAAGNAAVYHDGSKWTVMIDEPQSVVVGLITARNADEIRVERNRERLPDALLVPYLDRETNYEDAERIVPFPGSFIADSLAELEADLDWPAGTKAEVYGDDTPSNDGVYVKSGASGSGSWSAYSLDFVERWDRKGITSSEEAWNAGRREARRRTLRRRRITAKVDAFDAMTLPLGSLVMVDRGRRAAEVVSARVRKSIPASGLRQVIWLDEEIEQLAGHDYELRWRSLPDEGDEAEDDPPSLSYVLEVATIPGRSRMVVIKSPTGLVPAAGDLAIFGPAGGTGFEAIVAAIDGDRTMANVELYDHAPEIADEDPAPTEVPPGFEDFALWDDHDFLLWDEGDLMIWSD